MTQSIGLASVLVRDYDEALNFFVGILGFHLVEDTYIAAQDKRWIVVRPSGAGSGLLLAKAQGAKQTARIGDQTGGRVFLFLQTDDFWRDYRIYRERGVNFIREPKQESYGVVAVFQDICGNCWDLIEPSRTRADGSVALI